MNNKILLITRFSLLSGLLMAKIGEAENQNDELKEAKDFRPTVWGIDGETGWIPMLPEKELKGLEARGSWTRDKQSVTGTAGEDSAKLFWGAADWRNYEIDFYMTVISGGNGQVQFRISADGKKCYMMDFLLGWKAVGISKIDGTPGGTGLLKISVVNWDIERGKEYHVQIAVRDASITTYVDGKLVNQVTDSDYRQGRIAFNVWQGKTAFRDPRYRRLP